MEKPIIIADFERRIRVSDGAYPEVYGMSANEGYMLLGEQMKLMMLVMSGLPTKRVARDAKVCQYALRKRCTGLWTSIPALRHVKFNGKNRAVFNSRVLDEITAAQSWIKANIKVEEAVVSSSKKPLAIKRFDHFVDGLYRFKQYTSLSNVHFAVVITRMSLKGKSFTEMSKELDVPASTLARRSAQLWACLESNEGTTSSIKVRGNEPLIARILAELNVIESYSRKNSVVKVKSVPKTEAAYERAINVIDDKELDDMLNMVESQEEIIETPIQQITADTLIENTTKRMLSELQYKEEQLRAVKLDNAALFETLHEARYQLRMKTNEFVHATRTKEEVMKREMKLEEANELLIAALERAEVELSALKRLARDKKKNVGFFGKVLNKLAG